MPVAKHKSYKELLKDRLKELRRDGKKLTWREVAAKIPLQYTYLSKAMNDQHTHLSEDAVFIIAKLFGFYPEEIEYLVWLRSYEVSGDPERRKFLLSRIERYQRSRELSAELQDAKLGGDAGEMDYLFDPLSIVLHVSLDIPEYASNPHRLASRLGVDSKKMQESLRKLARLGMVELGERGEVVKVNKSHIHFGLNHPLMRMHQTALRAYSSAHLFRLSDAEKQSLMATFSATPETIQNIAAAFRQFMQTAEKLALKSKRPTNTYQLSFDLFQWV